MILLRLFVVTMAFVFLSFTGLAQSSQEGQGKTKQEVSKENQAEDKKADSTEKDSEKESGKTESQKKKEVPSDSDKPDNSSTEEPKASTDQKDQKDPSVQKASSDKTMSSSKAKKPRDVETLEVTGSYIRRSDIEGPSPIIVFNREQIENSGFDSVGSFLARHSTTLPFGGGGLRGLGSVRTLVLINGQRAPASGSSYGSGAVSTDIIPLAAVDRIEILKDGASATYGSDALGGVINVITKKNWDGISTVAKFNVADYKGGDSLRTSVAYGKSSSRGNFLTSLQYNHSTPLRRSDVERVAYFTDVRPQFSSNYTTPRGIQPNPRCKRKYKKRGAGDPLASFDGGCLDYVDSQFVSGPSHEINWVTDAEYEAFDLNFYSTLYLGYGMSKQTTYESFLSPPFSGEALSSWATEHTTRESTGLKAGQRVTLFHRLTELGDREDLSQGFGAGLILGVKGDLFNDWIWDVTLNNQFNRSMSELRNYALIAPVTEALRNGSYNPFGDPAQNSTEGFTDLLTTQNRYQVNWLEAKANGSFMDLYGINLAGAFGVSTAHFEYRDDRDDRLINREVFGITGSEGNGQRQLYAAFAELNALYRNIEGQLALRYDHYSDFGSTFNPKLALKYKLFDWMTFRTSFGTGFKAPTLQESYGPRLSYFANDVIDYKYCKDNGVSDKECASYGFEGVTGANPELTEETSQSFNFGMVLEPVRTSTMNLALTMDYWMVKIDDLIGTDTDGLLQAEAINPGAPAKYDVEVRRDPNDENKITFLDASLQNLGKREAHGIDFQASFEMTDPFFKGKITVTTDFTYMFHFYESFYEELGKFMVLGQQTFPRWRNVSSLGYSWGDFGGVLTSRTTPRVETQNRKGFTPEFTQFDLSLFYKAPWGGGFQLGAINAFNQQPEYDFSNRVRVNTALYTPERMFFLAYRQDF